MHNTKYVEVIAIVSDKDAGIAVRMLYSLSIISIYLTLMTMECN